MSYKQDVDGRSGKVVLKLVCSMCENDYAVQKRDDGLCSRCHKKKMFGNKLNTIDINKKIENLSSKIDNLNPNITINNTYNFNQYNFIFEKKRKRDSDENNHLELFRENIPENRIENDRPLKKLRLC